jgi:hypothetical protein
MGAGVFIRVRWCSFVFVGAVGDVVSMPQRFVFVAAVALSRRAGGARVKIHCTNRTGGTPPFA